MKIILIVIGLGLFGPVFLIGYAKFFSAIFTSATWISASLLYSSQGGSAPLFWISLCTAIILTCLNTVKSWMALKNGVICDDLGIAAPNGWNCAWATSDFIAMLTGVGLFITSIILGAKAGDFAGGMSFSEILNDLSLPESLPPFY